MPVPSGPDPGGRPQAPRLTSCIRTPEGSPQAVIPSPGSQDRNKTSPPKRLSHPSSPGRSRGCNRPDDPPAREADGERNRVPVTLAPGTGHMQGGIQHEGDPRSRRACLPSGPRGRPPLPPPRSQWGRAFRNAGPKGTRSRYSRPAGTVNRSVCIMAGFCSGFAPAPLLLRIRPPVQASRPMAPTGTGPLSRDCLHAAASRAAVRSEPPRRPPGIEVRNRGNRASSMTAHRCPGSGSVRNRRDFQNLHGGQDRPSLEGMVPQPGRDGDPHGFTFPRRHGGKLFQRWTVLGSTATGLPARFRAQWRCGPCRPGPPFSACVMT
jgi:hypothetical protein